MPPVLTATVLALTAAVLHASWNFLVKTSDDRDLAAWAQFLAGSLLFLPVLLVIGPPGLETVPYLLASGVIHVVYVAALVAAYCHGDFSLAYPLSRGTGAVLAALGGVLLLGDHLPWPAWAAIAVVAGGLALLVGRGTPLVEFRFALLTGATIGVYTLVDSAGSRAATDGLAYAITVTIASATFLTVWGLARGRGPALVRSVLPSWRRYLLAGGCLTGAYSLVLVAVRFAPVGYVAVLRESSIVLGAYAGWVFLGERLGGRRLRASLVITAGLVALILVR